MNIESLDCKILNFSEKLSKCQLDLYKDFQKQDSYKNFVWKEASPEIFQLVAKFRNLCIDNDYTNMYEVFDKNFGIHNTFELFDYLNFEFNEFHLKCEKFGLTKDADIHCYEISDNMVYFSLGKKNDKALFESIFYYNKETQRFRGNQYCFTIEPKMQFKIDASNQYSYRRRINIKSYDKDLVFKALLPRRDGENFVLESSTLPDFLGGHFYNTNYEAPYFGENTYWEILKIVTNFGIVNYPVLMRGRDHPLFVDNLYCNLDAHKISFKSGIFPAILSVFFYDKDNEEFFKYPTINSYHFDNEVFFTCLTDNLSYDWIIERPKS